MEGIVPLVEPGHVLHVRRADQPAVGGVGPCVIGALDRLGEPTRRVLTDTRAAMPADVEEDAQSAVASAHDDE